MLYVPHTPRHDKNEKQKNLNTHSEIVHDRLLQEPMKL